MKPIICSFYTKEYLTLANRMVESAKRWGYETDVIEIEKIHGKWLDTIYWRANFVDLMLKKHQRPIVWLDCDAVIESDPVLFESIDADFAAHVHTFKWAKDELLGGTMFFNYTPKCFELIDTWLHFNKVIPKENLSQKVIKAAFKHWDGKFFELPASYCQIFDLMADCGTPIISHHQASRQFRND